MDLIKSYPRKDWSEELKQAFDEELKYRNRWKWFLLPYEKFIEFLTRKYKEKRNIWDGNFYEDWDKTELTWRVLFLQDCGRDLYIRLTVVKFAIPILVFCSLLIGILLK